MNKGRIAAIIKKDISAVTGSAQMWMPMVIVPLFFVVFIPALIAVLAQNLKFSDLNNPAMLEKYLISIPSPELAGGLAPYPELMQKAVYLFANYLFAPMFLMLPVMVSSIIAAGSFAGEKEKKTLESLLYTPVTEKELFFAKIGSAFLPAMAVSVVGFIIYGALFDAIAYPMMGQLFFPSWNWLPFMLLLVPGFSLLSIGLTVMVSARVKGFAEAQQIAALIVLPILLIMVSQIFGVMFLSAAVSAIVGAVVLAADYFIVARAAKTFDRERLLKNYAGN